MHPNVREPSAVGLLYADGRFADEAPLRHDDHAALFGAGFFETFRTRDGAPLRLEAHLARLHAACERIGVRIPDSALAASSDPGRWRAVIASLLDAHKLRDGVFRLTLTAGENAAPLGAGDYATPHERLTCRALPAEAPPGGITLHLLATPRDTGEWRPRPKSLNYLNSLLAARELAPRRTHPADEGLLFDAGGRVCEGVFTNLFWVRGKVVFTPHENTGLLPGVGRAHLLHRLRADGVPVEEVEAGVEELARADAVATVGSVRGVTPVARILGAGGAPVWRAANDAAGLRALLRAWGE